MSDVNEFSKHVTLALIKQKSSFHRVYPQILEFVNLCLEQETFTKPPIDQYWLKRLEEVRDSLGWTWFSVHHPRRSKRGRNGKPKRLPNVFTSYIVGATTPQWVRPVREVEMRKNVTIKKKHTRVVADPATVFDVERRTKEVVEEETVRRSVAVEGVTIPTDIAAWVTRRNDRIATYHVRGCKNPYVVRKFHTDWQSNGRFYSGVHCMTKEARLAILWNVDGKWEPACEPDYNAFFLRIVAALNGHQLPTGDLYDGIWGKTYKQFVKDFINSSISNSRILRGYTDNMKAWLKENNLPRPNIADLTAAVLKRYPFLSKLPVWGYTHWVGSEIARAVVDKLDAAGVPVFDVHDSFNVPVSCERVCMEAMVFGFQDILSRLTGRTVRDVPLVKPNRGVQHQTSVLLWDKQDTSTLPPSPPSSTSLPIISKFDVGQQEMPINIGKVSNDKNGQHRGGQRAKHREKSYTEAQEQEVLRLHRDNKSLRAIAELTGVKKSTVSNIIKAATSATPSTPVTSSTPANVPDLGEARTLGGVATVEDLKVPKAIQKPMTLLERRRRDQEKRDQYYRQRLSQLPLKVLNQLNVDIEPKNDYNTTNGASDGRAN
jgi:hypothetical protein